MDHKQHLVWGKIALMEETAKHIPGIYLHSIIVAGIKKFREWIEWEQNEFNGGILYSTLQEVNTTLKMIKNLTWEI